MSKETQVGVGSLSIEELVELDLGHMRGLADVLKPHFQQLQISSPLEQEQILIEAAQKAKKDYEALGYQKKVEGVDRVLKAFSEKKLSMTDLLTGLGLIEPVKERKGGFLGRFKR